LIIDNARIIQELEKVIGDIDSVYEAAMNVVGPASPWRKMGPAERATMITRAETVIDRYSDTSSVHRRAMNDWLDENGRFDWETLPTFQGILRALRDDYQSGYAIRVEDLVHRDTFDNFIDMADYLVSEGYSDQGLITATGVLEQRLRSMAATHSVPIKGPKGEYRPASAINQDLHSAGAYRGKAELHLVNAWLAMRNEPAHGNFDKVHMGQASKVIREIRDFLARYP
jgi:hypothetical protein